jgi:hypothetical protein
MGISFHEFYHLKEKYHDRKTLMLTPEKDASLFLANPSLQKNIYSAVDEAFLREESPKILLHGPYGSGKTHILYHLKNHIEEKYGEVCCFYIKLNGVFNSKSTYQDLHQEIFRTIGHPQIVLWLEAYLKKHERRELSALMGDELAHALILLSEREKTLLPGEAGWDSNAKLAWKWLLGLKLLAGEKKEADLPFQLFEGGTSTRLAIQLLLSLGKILSEIDKKMVLLFDEVEHIQEIRSRDGQASFFAPFRELADHDNSYIGFVLAHYLPELSGTFLSRQDFKSRIGDATFDISEETSIESLKHFLSRLLDEFILEDVRKKEKSYPFFDEKAFHAFFEELEKYSKHLDLLVTPRFLLKTFSLLTRSIFERSAQKKKEITPPISSDELQRFFEEGR